jgi:hypothetical protein
MIFYTITAASNFLERPRIKAFHAGMFHGLAKRDKFYPNDTTEWADSNAAATPLSIYRTVHGIPPICKPSTHLIVNEALANKLLGVPNIQVARVTFARLADIFWQKGDDSWFDKWGETDSFTLLTKQPNVPSIRAPLDFFEIRTYRLNDILPHFTSAKEIAIEHGTPPLHEGISIRLSSQMLTEYPMLWWYGVIVNAEVFQILGPQLDQDFFVVRKYQIE